MKYICILLYAIINALFVDKYGARISDYHALITAAYTLVAVLGVYFLPRLLQRLKRPTPLLIALGTLTLALGIALQYTIDPYTLQVDRWSAIHHFLDGLMAGTYPYAQQTHLGGYGSPLPVWQVLHLPFYAIGNVGLSILLVTALFVYVVYRYHSARQALLVLLLLVVSPAWWYELAVRSDLITNLLLVATLTQWLAHHQIRLAERYIYIGVLCGLLASTRLIALIPLAAMYGYEFLQMGWRRQLAFLSATLLTFAITLLPFVLWEGSTLLFFEYNPFVLQTRQGSLLSLAVFAVIAIAMTVYTQSSEQLRLPMTGALLTSLVVIAFMEKMWREHLWTELYSSSFDITYLSVALPFYILCLATSGGESDS